MSAALEGLTDAEVWKEVERRRSGYKPGVKGIRDAEVETLLSTADEIGEDRPGGDFYARSVKLNRGGPMRNVSRVVKVHRLREVIAQVGFTRFEAPVSDVNGELGVERAAVSNARRCRSTRRGSPQLRIAAKACSSGSRQTRSRHG